MNSFKKITPSLPFSKQAHSQNNPAQCRVKALKHARTCILSCRPGPCLLATWQTRQKTATQVGTVLNNHAPYCDESTSAALFPVTCCAVSIRSFPISSIWNPLSRTSSVDAGTDAKKGDCKDRDERLHRSSMGNCENKAGLFIPEHT